MKNLRDCAGVIVIWIIAIVILTTVLGCATLKDPETMDRIIQALMHVVAIIQLFEEEGKLDDIDDYQVFVDCLQEQVLMKLENNEVIDFRNLEEFYEACK